jgi:hypothetical protein
LTNYALWTGRGYLSQPGIAGYDMLYTVTRRGSDVAARATLHVGGGMDATVYAGLPYNGDARYLLTVRWSI